VPGKRNIKLGENLPLKMFPFMPRILDLGLLLVQSLERGWAKQRKDLYTRIQKIEHRMQEF
jgi:hypothetical protein